MSSGVPTLQSTFEGYVATTHDALILFEACLSKNLPYIGRRLHDQEKSSLVKSGYVIIYHESERGIKRGTDGVPWSPSRKLGDFLVYRELPERFLTSEDRHAIQTKQRQFEELHTESEASNTVHRRSDELVGSLINSYNFKKDGLVKKTISGRVEGTFLHLVAYYHYHVNDINNLRTPSQTKCLQWIHPRPELYKFRDPVKVVDEVDGSEGASPGLPFWRSIVIRPNKCRHETVWKP